MMGTVRWGTAAIGSDPIDWSHDGNTSAFRDEGQPGEAANAWRRIEPLVTMNDELTVGGPPDVEFDQIHAERDDVAKRFERIRCPRRSDHPRGRQRLS